jgi:hypothetical protein
MIDYRKTKWWIRLIRERNYFGFRYWWFNWLLLLFAFLVFYLLWTPSYFKTESCNANDSLINSKSNSIISALDRCCPCLISMPRPDTLPAPADTIPSPPKPDTVAVECPNRLLVFQVCNSNGKRDDNFDVYLNGSKIGSLDLNSNALVGSVFIASKNHNVKIKDADFTCPIHNMKVYYFNPSLVKYGSNTIKMKNVQRNGNGNAGNIQIRNYLLTGNYLSAPCRVNDLIFAFDNGADHSIDFNYTRCCE